MERALFSVVCVALSLATLAYGHGHLKDPPNRASLWRYNYNAPVNKEDNNYRCGSIKAQWGQYNGQCGECGDSFGDKRPRSNENGGTYGLGLITRRYTAGDVVKVSVEVTINHLGSFLFSLCPLNTSTSLEHEDCFQRNVLELADGSGTRYTVPSANNGTYVVHVKLPEGLTCDRCVLQWHYDTADAVRDCRNGTTAAGCGRQTVYRSCADIAIDPQNYYLSGATSSNFRRKDLILYSLGMIVAFIWSKFYH